MESHRCLEDPRPARRSSVLRLGDPEQGILHLIRLHALMSRRCRMHLDGRIARVDLACGTVSSHQRLQRRQYSPEFQGWIPQDMAQLSLIAIFHWMGWLSLTWSRRPCPHSPMQFHTTAEQVHGIQAAGMNHPGTQRTQEKDLLPLQSWEQGAPGL